MDEFLMLSDIRFSGLCKVALLKESDTIKHVVTVNAQFIIEAEHNKRLRDIINSNYATIDGQIVYYLLKRKYKTAEFEKIAGSDFIYDVCTFAQSNKERVFLLGGKESANTTAIEKLKKMYGIEVDGYSPPYSPYPFSDEQNQIIRQKIEAFQPHYLFVGFGIFKQEFWIDDHMEILNNTGVKLAVGCGGTFEFVSGELKRAPLFIQKIGMEGLFRLITQPQWYRLKRLLTAAKVLKYIFK